MRIAADSKQPPPTENRYQIFTQSVDVFCSVPLRKRRGTSRTVEDAIRPDDGSAGPVWGTARVLTCNLSMDVRWRQSSSTFCLEGRAFRSAAINVEISPDPGHQPAGAFRQPRLSAWLNNSDRKINWHRSGVPDEWSNIVVMVDPSLTGARSDSHMPESIGHQILSTCQLHIAPRGSVPHVMVRLTNDQ